MSEEPTPMKYFVIDVLIEDKERRDYFHTQLNDAYNQGYRVHSFNTQYEQGEYAGIGSKRYTALMSFNGPSKYEDITHIDEVATMTDAQELLDHGWEILETYAKKIRMVKRGE